jgi:hypothetical protein
VTGPRIDPDADPPHAEDAGYISSRQAGSDKIGADPMAFWCAIGYRTGVPGTRTGAVGPGRTG